MSDSARPISPRDYGLATSVRARLMGATLAATGAVLLVGTLVISLTGLPLVVLGGLVVLATVGVVALGTILGPRRYVVRLDDTGYQVRFVRGVGRSRARWTDVVDLKTAVVSGTECVVLRLRDGQSSTVPVNVIEGDREEFVGELQRRLDAGHGYRPL